MRRTYLKSQLHQVMTFECSMCTGHGNDFGFLHEQILGAVQSTPQQLKGPELLQGKQERR